MNFIKRHKIKLLFTFLLFIFLGILVSSEYRVKIHQNNIEKNNQAKTNEQASSNTNSSLDNNSQQTSNQNNQQSSQQAIEDQKQQDYIKGYNLLYEKNYDDAIKAEDQVILMYPDFYKAYDIKGIAQCYKGNYKEGVSNIERCLQLKDDYGHGRFDMGLANELQANYDTAIEWYKKALEIEKYEWSYYGIASIYGRRGDVQNTVEYLKQAIAINPNVKDEARHEADFNNVKNSAEFKDVVN
ncbi:tetratricopeptide repeat protein [Clostridium sp. 19966]|uniref:tetratricopeptide repeat protein n=1 Tax=Clostridium sp. 19966 TaxID=2768166 RepID=UPI0028DE9E7E|nr:tetratricopeptide repeat protein [Clostridium sp. 19966]MDT8715521.1 tetratricopeptide repeat protein [Clostridium sp. 19966]